MSIVEAEFLNGIGTLIINNGAKRNALSQQLIDDAVVHLDNFRTDSARVVVIRAPKGATVFSAGHDVADLPRKGRDPLGYNDPLEVIIRAIRHFPAPVICMIEGTVWGGACELCLACDLLVCEKNVTFAVTPAKLAVPYNTTGLLNIRNALGGHVVREMLFTASPIGVERLHRIGVVNYICEAEELEEVTYRLAADIMKNSPLSITTMKEQLRILDNAAPLSPETFERLQALRREVYDSADYEEGLRAFLEKRPAVFKAKYHSQNDDRESSD